LKLFREHGQASNDGELLECGLPWGFLGLPWKVNFNAIMEHWKTYDSRRIPFHENL
jgi:hypothetical protein